MNETTLSPMLRRIFRQWVMVGIGMLIFLAVIGFTQIVWEVMNYGH